MDNRHANIPVNRKSFYDLTHISALVLVPGVLAWVFGRPLIFPSLGPSAFVLVRNEGENRARQVIGGHPIGVVNGLVAHHALAKGLTLAGLSQPLSDKGIHIVASAVISMALTTVLMSVARANHAPACATTLIVSLGVLPGLDDSALIMLAVISMFVAHHLIMMVRKPLSPAE
jgi:hypothetical protein